MIAEATISVNYNQTTGPENKSQIFSQTKQTMLQKSLYNVL